MTACGGAGGPATPSSAAPSPPLAPPTPTPPPVRPPTASIAEVEPFGVAIAFVTRVSLGAAGTSPAGYPLTFQWDFGDGSSGLGPGVSHIYNKVGIISVSLNASDDHGGSATDQRAVRTGLLDGTWDACCVEDRQTTARIIQDASSVRGTFQNFSFSGRLADPRAMSLRVSTRSCSSNYEGSVGDSLNDVSLTGLDCLGHAAPLRFVRKSP